MVKLRKENPALVYGKYELFDKDNPTIYAYARTLDSEQFLIVLNFSSVEQYYSTPESMKAKKLKVVIDNYGNTEWRNTAQIGLKPYEAVIFKAIK
jgi:oligo-1,6-glucosidase